MFSDAASAQAEGPTPRAGTASGGLRSVARATRGNSQIAAVRGRILYDFGGNACDGYSLQFRQVSELDTGEGKVSTSDLRSTTWEGGDAKSFKFTTRRISSTGILSTPSTAMPSTAASRDRRQIWSTTGAQVARSRRQPWFFRPSIWCA